MLKYIEGNKDITVDNVKINNLLEKYSKELDEFKLKCELGDSSNFLEFLVERNIIDALLLNDNEKELLLNYLVYGKYIIEFAENLDKVRGKLDWTYCDYKPIKIEKKNNFDCGYRIILTCQTQELVEVKFSYSPSDMWRFEAEQVELRASYLEGEYILRGLNNHRIACDYTVYFDDLEKYSI